MTVWERIRIFPTSVSRLWKDWLLYQNIRDAAATPRNAWTIPGTTTTTTTKNANNNTVDAGQTVVSTAEVPLLVAKQMVHSHIPWRQREQQRRFLDGLSTVLPVVVLWCVPIVGYVPMLLAIAAPRQLLSRHFHNDYEAVQYNRLAYRQRHAHFAAVVRGMCSIRTKKDDVVSDDETTPATWIETWHKNCGGGAAVDAAGPVLDNLLPFYQAVFARSSSTPTGTISNGPLWLSSVDRFPRNYLVHFALAVGVYETFPSSSWSATLAQWSPSWYLRRRVRHIALTVEDDDHALLLQRETSFGAKRGAAVVAQLTEMEVTDACLVRGLPIIHINIGEHDDDDGHQYRPLTAEQMRKCLSNHLDMLASLEEQIAAQQLQQQAQDDSESHRNSDGDNCSPPQQQRRRRRLLSVNEEALGLFTLHLTILRDHLKTRR